MEGEVIYIRVLQVSHGSFPVKPTDTLRINITKLPGNSHRSYKFQEKDRYQVNHVWKLQNYSGKTKKILITLRKKDFWNLDPIIGRIIIPLNKMPLNQVAQMVFDLNCTMQNPSIDKAQMRLELHRCNDHSYPFNGPTVPVWDF